MRCQVGEVRKNDRKLKVTEEAATDTVKATDIYHTERREA